MLTPEERRTKELLDGLSRLSEELKAISGLVAKNIQQQADSEAARQATYSHPNKPPIHVITESSDTERTQRNTEQNASNRLQISAVRVQKLLCFLTFCAFAAAFWYASIAEKQMWLMQGQWMTMDAQWLTMRDTLAEIQKQTPDLTRSADAAKSAADTAKDGVSKSDRFFQLDQRPYIFVQVTSLGDLQTRHRIDEPVIGKPLVVNLEVTNIGKSPALDCIIHRHMVFGRSADIRPEPIDTGKIGMLIPSGQPIITTAVSFKNTYSNESVDLVGSEVINWDGSNPVIVFGRITYRDRFENSYCAPFAFELIPRNWVTLAFIKDGNFRLKTTDLCPRETGKL